MMAGSKSSSPQTFNPKVVFGLILFGALAFLATLYFIGAGDTGGDANDGGAHAGGKGLNGYAALVAVLEEQGQDVRLSRTQSMLTEDSLLILTPPMYTDAEELRKMINDRRFIGPTLVIVPKWASMDAQWTFNGDVKEGWVELLSSDVPEWAAELGEPFGEAIDLQLNANVADQRSERNWSGLSLSGSLPDARYSSAESSWLTPLVTNAKGRTLAGFLDDESTYPTLSEAAGVEIGDYDEEDLGEWPVTFIVEPDLVNNYGFADPQRAELAVALVELAKDGTDLPVVFDLTLNGYGNTKNLLTLAFTAPFLAATLCLILAMIVVAWRAFRRFGPPVAEGRSIAFGKARLIKNSAGFIQRSRRLHLLSGPYAEMTRERIASALALRTSDDAAIDKALARRLPDAPTFSTSAQKLRAAKSPNDILRAAAALKRLERMLSK